MTRDEEKLSAISQLERVNQLNLWLLSLNY
jgi:hypothetical protein